MREHLARRGPATRFGLVPTMGALHDGHVALVSSGPARRACTSSRRFSSIPGQFNDPADLAAYPRQESRDMEIAEVRRRRCALHAIRRGDISAERRDIAGSSRRSAGFRRRVRPGHFDSVATVCIKLFNIVDPTSCSSDRRTLNRSPSFVRRFVICDSISRSSSCPPSANQTAWRCRRETSGSLLTIGCGPSRYHARCRQESSHTPQDRSRRCRPRRTRRAAGGLRRRGSFRWRANSGRRGACRIDTTYRQCAA